MEACHWQHDAVSAHGPILSECVYGHLLLWGRVWWESHYAVPTR